MGCNTIITLGRPWMWPLFLSSFTEKERERERERKRERERERERVRERESEWERERESYRVRAVSKNSRLGDLHSKKGNFFLSRTSAASSKYKIAPLRFQVEHACRARWGRGLWSDRATSFAKGCVPKDRWPSAPLSTGFLRHSFAGLHFNDRFDLLSANRVY